MEDESAIPAETSLSLLAQEKFGDNFHGEVKEPEPPEEEQEEELPIAAETEEEIEEEPKEEPKEEEESGEEVISSVDELVDFLKEEQGLEIDSEWFESLKVKGKVNGEDVDYSLGDLKEAHQKVQAADNILDGAKEKLKAQYEEMNEKTEKVVEQFSIASTLVDNLEQALMSDYQTIDLEKLRTDDPAEYSAKQIDYQRRQQEIQNIKLSAATQYNQWVEQQQEETKAAAQEQLVAEQEALLTKLPSWQDGETAKTEKAAVSEYLASVGFEAEEIKNVLDHRLILVARKAWLYDQQSQSTNAAKKKIAKIPKTLKSGPKKSQGQGQNQEIARLEKKLKATGSIQDARALQLARKAL